MFPERRRHTLRHRDEPSSTAFRRGHLPSPIRMANADPAALEVNVRPLERHDLADSQSTFTAE